MEADPTDVDAIAGALSAVAADDELRARLVGRGAGPHARDLTWAASAPAHVELWESLP